MNTYFYCEWSYYKKLFIGLFALSLSAFLISLLVPIQKYANMIYIASVLVMLVNILISIFKIIFLSLGLMQYDDCNGSSILRRVGNWISNIV